MFISILDGSIYSTEFICIASWSEKPYKSGRTLLSIGKSNYRIQTQNPIFNSHFRIYNTTNWCGKLANWFHVYYNGSHYWGYKPSKIQYTRWPAGKFRILYWFSIISSFCKDLNILVYFYTIWPTRHRSRNKFLLNCMCWYLICNNRSRKWGLVAFERNKVR